MSAEPHAAPDAGSMDVTEQRSTYRVFDFLVRWGSLGVASALLFLTLLFCTAVGFFGAAIPTVILLVAGIVVLRKAPMSIDTL